MFSPDCKIRPLRIPRLLRLALLATACLAGASFHAQSLEAARLAWEQGRFIEAADIAARLGSSDGYALAAESLAVHGFHIATGKEQEEIFARATEYGIESVELDPGNINAHLQLSHAMGRYAQVVGVVEMLGNRYVWRVRDAVETAVELDPESPVAHLGIAMWHAEALDKAGLFARLLFRASSTEALKHIDIALEHGSNEKVVQTESAYALLLLSKRRHGERARQLLQNSRELPVRHVWDGFLHERSLQLLAEFGEPQAKGKR